MSPTTSSGKNLIKMLETKRIAHERQKSSEKISIFNNIINLELQRSQKKIDSISHQELASVTSQPDPQPIPKPTAAKIELLKSMKERNDKKLINIMMFDNVSNDSKSTLNLGVRS